MNWNHVVTRIFALFEMWLATEVYSGFPVKEGGLRMDTVVLGKDGIIDRYVDQDGLDEFEHLAKTQNFVSLLESFRAYETSVMPFFEKNPIDNREEFLGIFRQLYIHEITAFYLGLYTADPESVEIICDLRGSHGAQHVATSEFLPKLYAQASMCTGVDADLLKYALPGEMLSLSFDPEALALRRTLYVIESIDGAMKLLVGDDAGEYTCKFLVGCAGFMIEYGSGRQSEGNEDPIPRIP